MEGLVWMEEFKSVLFALSSAVDEVVETHFAVLLLALVTPQCSSLQTGQSLSVVSDGSNEAQDNKE